MLQDPAVPSPAPPAPVVEGKRFAPRAVAYIIDIVAVNVLDYVIGYAGASVFLLGLYFIAALFAYEPTVGNYSPTILDFLLGIILSIVFFATFEALFGATPGKIILRMRVSSVSGHRPSLFAALTRGLWRLIDGLFFGLVAASSMTAPLRQRYGDKRAKTVVVASNSTILKDRPSALLFLLAILIYSIVSLVFQILLLLPYIRFREIG